MAARFALGDNLPQLVERTYQQACSLSKVIFTPSAEVAVIRTSTGLPVCALASDHAEVAQTDKISVVPTALLPITRKEANRP